MDVIDNTEHVRICPALIHHRQLRFLLMAEALASIGDALHHNTALRFSPAITQCEHAPRTCSRTHIEPFHEHTPIRTLPQIRALPPDAANTLRVGIWRLETEHKRALRGVMLTPRAHIMTALAALHFAPTIDTAHALVPAMEHASLAHSELCQFVRLIPPYFLRWLIQEFGIKGEVYSTHIRSHVSLVSMPQSMITEPLQKYQPFLGVYRFTPHIKLNIPSQLMANSPACDGSITIGKFSL